MEHGTTSFTLAQMVWRLPSPPSYRAQPTLLFLRLPEDPAALPLRELARLARLALLDPPDPTRLDRLAHPARQTPILTDMVPTAARRDRLALTRTVMDLTAARLSLVPLNHLDLPARLVLRNQQAPRDRQARLVPPVHQDQAANPRQCPSTMDQSPQLPTSTDHLLPPHLLPPQHLPTVAAALPGLTPTRTDTVRTATLPARPDPAEPLTDKATAEAEAHRHPRRKLAPRLPL